MVRFRSVFGIAVAAFVGCASLISPAKAAVVTYDLVLTPGVGSTIGGTGSLVLDVAIPSSGLFNVPIADVSSLTFTIDGHEFGTGFSTFALSAVQFLNGALRDITFSSAISSNRISLMTTAAYSYTNGLTGQSSSGSLAAELVPTPAVPEASTWAMLIVGFAGLGFLGYRRSRAARSRLLHA